MQTRSRRARGAVRPDLAHDALSPLPRCFVREVWLRLNVFERMCAYGVCRSWRASCADASLWTDIDMSFCNDRKSGDADGVLQVAGNKACGGLVSLDLGDCLRKNDDGSVTWPIVMEVLEANARSLTTLRLGTRYLSVEQLESVLRAVPCLEAMHASVAFDYEDWTLPEEERTAIAVEIKQVVRREGQFSPLCLHKVWVSSSPLRAYYGDLDSKTLGFVRDLAANPPLKVVSLRNQSGGGPALRAAALEELVTAAVQNGWTDVDIWWCSLQNGSLQMLARLLGSPHLDSFELNSNESAEGLFLDEAGVGAFSAGLQTSSLT